MDENEKVSAQIERLKQKILEISTERDQTGIVSEIDKELLRKFQDGLAAAMELADDFGRGQAQRKQQLAEIGIDWDGSDRPGAAIVTKRRLETNQMLRDIRELLNEEESD